MAKAIQTNNMRKLARNSLRNSSATEVILALRLKDATGVAYYCHDQRSKQLVYGDETISPRRIIYKKCRVRHSTLAINSDCGDHNATDSVLFNVKKQMRNFNGNRLMTTGNTFVILISLILINQFMQLLGPTSTFVAAAAVASNSALLVDDLLQYNGGVGSSGRILSELNGAGSSSDGILISSNFDSDNLNLVNSNSNKTLSSFSLSSNQPADSSVDALPTVISGGTGSGSSISGSSSSSSSSNIGAGYLDKIDNLERSVAAVLIKVAYGTTSTTKRSIPDNSYVPSLTTIATPPLTTLRYLEKSQHQQQINLHHRNYELDLERDHALPTSAPNADILKSNSNPTYPNPNRHHNHDRHRHSGNSTPSPSLHSMQKKGPPTNPMYSIDMPSYSPPARSFLTPPLPPEYTNPFADKPTLRGTNNDGGPSSVSGGGSNGGSGVSGNSYISRRPIPPPSLMPGQERIPLRPPDLNGGSSEHSIGKPSFSQLEDDRAASSGQRKKALNTPSQKINNKVEYDKPPPNSGSSSQHYDHNSSALNETLINSGGTIAANSGNHFQGISRILSGSNGRKEEIPEVLLRTATVRPNNPQPPQSPIGHQPLAGTGQNPNINQRKNGKNFEAASSVGSIEVDENIDSKKAETSIDLASSRGGNDGETMVGESVREEINRDGSNDYDENFDMFIAAEPQPKIKISTKSTEIPNVGGAAVTSTQIGNNVVRSSQKSVDLTTPTTSDQAKDMSGSKIGVAGSTASGGGGGGSATWTVAWNIHVYLSAILFTILAVYSIFKMIFYDKLTHLFSQSYFICIHLILIVICMTRIFYLCYDAYNIHSSFHIFVSEVLLNLPATFLTIAFSVLILFLLIRSLNHKNNRYSALIRPLTVVVGGSVHVGLCITLHYVESYTTTNNQHLYYYQQQLYRNSGTATGRLAATGTASHHHLHHLLVPPPPPRVLSLICQIIYIFVCLSLGLLYLYLYRILKRVLRSKSQNYIHGYQNLSYAIHITIATALLFVLLSALQIYGALSISTNRPLIASGSEIDWLQWGYQFSLRLIEIAIITLMSWVAGLKTGGSSGMLQREKATAADTHNVSGFALFPCTSSSSQEHFEADYPAVCNANTNLHTYTLRTGKPIYDDNFALNSLNGGASGSGSGGIVNSSTSGGSQQSSVMHQPRLPHDYQIQNPGGSAIAASDFIRSYETSSLRSAPHHLHHNHSSHILDSQSAGVNGSNFTCDSQTDHYENPNFELHSSTSMGGVRHQHHRHQDNCYSEPTNPYGTNATIVSTKQGYGIGYDFQNFERPTFGAEHQQRPSSRTDSHHMMSKGSVKGGSTRDRYHINGQQPQQQQNALDRSNYENPERRSSNSTHSCSSNRNYSAYNSFDRRNSGVRKSGTLNNIGNLMHNGSGRNNSSSSSSSSSNHRLSGIQTLNSTHNRTPGRSIEPVVAAAAAASGGGKQQVVGSSNGFYRDRSHHHHRSTLERSNSSQQQQQYITPSSDDTDDFGCPNPERATLINNSSSSGGSGIGHSTGSATVDTSALTNGTSGGNLTDPVGNGAGVTNSSVGATSSCSSGGDSANSACMLVAEHGFVRFRALDDMNNAQGVGIHNASIRATSGATTGSATGGSNRYQDKQRCFTNST